MIRAIRHGREKKEEIYEPIEWPPKRRSEPTREPARKRPQRREDAPRRKREKVPG